MYISQCFSVCPIREYAQTFLFRFLVSVCIPNLLYLYLINVHFKLNKQNQ